MEQVFIISISITILYFLCKVAEMKYLDKEVKPFKTVIRDTFIVLFSSLTCSSGYFYFQKNINDFLNIITDKTALSNATNTQVFTDEPGF